MKVFHVIELNKVVKYIESEKNQVVFPHLDLNSIELITYTDANFNNLQNGGSQDGYILFITNNGQKHCPLVWNSNKVKHVVRSTLTTEALALRQGCESTIYISKKLRGTTQNLANPRAYSRNLG